MNDPVVTKRPDNADGVMDYMNRHRRQKDRLFLHRERQNIVTRAVVLGVILCAAAYLAMPASKIKTISVTGDNYLPETYIREIAGVSTDSRFCLTFTPFVKSRIGSDPMVQSVQVKKKSGHIVTISVTEQHPVGYLYEETPEILLADGTVIELKSEYLEMVARIPLISGFNSEESRKKLATALSELDMNTIEDISEITTYSFSYDKEAVKVLMRTGGYYLGTYKSLYALDRYNEVYSVLNDKSMCIYGVEGQDKAIARLCPWDDTANAEYWTDNEGNPIKNSSGDPVIKNYYTDASGKPALDDSGNKIPIPIDEDGHEVQDGDFQENYKAGYYSTGVLVLPDTAQ